MSDNPYVPQNSDTSSQDDLSTVQTTGFGRRRMVTALLHGHSRSGADHPRRWPFAVTGILATGLVAAGIGIADAYQDQKAADSGGLAVPAVIVQAAEPTETPTSQPTSPATQKPQPPPATKKSPPPSSAPKQNATKRPATSKNTKPSATKQRKPTSTKTSKSGTTKDRSGNSGSKTR